MGAIWCHGNPSFDPIIVIGPLVAEIFMFEFVDDDDGRRADAGPSVYYNLSMSRAKNRLFSLFPIEKSNFRNLTLP